MESTVEIAPLRSLHDFLLESARFQLPNFRDLDKWSNRVFNNMLYYQTNYYLMSVIVFLIVGFMNPAKMLCGVVAMAAALALFCYVTNSKRSATKFKKDHPVISLLLIFGAGSFVVYMFSCVLVFALGVMLPISLMFIHASLRLRNVKNKLTNKIEQVGLKKTPMGMFFEALGCYTEIQSEKFMDGIMKLKQKSTALGEKFIQDRIKVMRDSKEK